MTTTTLQAKNLMPTLTVNDLKQSIRFYTEGLGFSLGEKFEENGEMKGVMLNAGGATLGISQDDFAKGRDRVKGLGMRLYFETDQNIEALAAKAKAAGITPNEGPAPLSWGPMGFTVTDPDGFKMTIANPS